jgi:aspartate aminotransferase
VPVVLKHEKGYVYDPAEIASKITSRTKAIFVNSPHNPTGAVMPKEVLEKILELAQKRGLYIVTVEANEDVTYDAHPHSMAALARAKFDEAFQKRIISIFSFSKSYAMSGLRVGYIVTQDPALQERISKLLRCTINGVNSVAQWAAIEAVQGDRAHLENMRKEYRIRRDLMLKALEGVPGLHPYKPEGAFYVWCKIDPSLYPKMGVKNADELSQLLAEKYGLGSAPGDSFGVHCDDAIRFAYSCSTEMVKEGTAVMAKVFHQG